MRRDTTILLWILIIMVGVLILVPDLAPAIRELASYHVTVSPPQP